MRNLIDRILEETNPESNPYFDALRSGTFAKDDFLETQIQFYYAVVFFSRPMAALAAKIPNAGQRIEVLRNVWEEHGEGDALKMHGETFKDLLGRLDNLSQQDIESRALWPEVRAFNTVLIGCTVMDDWEIGAACLGMIECMFADISGWIGTAMVDLGWIRTEDLVHYKIHEDLDIRHSEDFFATINRSWARDDASRYRIEQGFRLGAYTFDQLYRGLFAARHRRSLAPVHLPQSNVYSG